MSPPCARFGYMTVMQTLCVHALNYMPEKSSPWPVDFCVVEVCVGPLVFWSSSALSVVCVCTVWALGSAKRCFMCCAHSRSVTPQVTNAVYTVFSIDKTQGAHCPLLLDATLCWCLPACRSCRAANAKALGVAASKITVHFSTASTTPSMSEQLAILEQFFENIRKKFSLGTTVSASEPPPPFPLLPTTPSPRPPTTKHTP